MRVVRISMIALACSSTAAAQRNVVLTVSGAGSVRVRIEAQGWLVATSEANWTPLSDTVTLSVPFSLRSSEANAPRALLVAMDSGQTLHVFGQWDKPCSPPRWIPQPFRSLLSSCTSVGSVSGSGNRMKVTVEAAELRLRSGQD